MCQHGSFSIYFSRALSTGDTIHIALSCVLFFTKSNVAEDLKVKKGQGTAIKVKVYLLLLILSDITTLCSPGEEHADFPSTSLVRNITNLQVKMDGTANKALMVGYGHMNVAFTLYSSIVETSLSFHEAVARWESCIGFIIDMLSFNRRVIFRQPAH